MPAAKTCPHGVRPKGGCRECRSAYKRKWAASHPHYSAMWRAANLEKAHLYEHKYRRSRRGRGAASAWKAANREGLLAYDKKRGNRMSPEEACAAQNRRRARRIANGVEKYRRSDILARDGGVCYLCKFPVDPKKYHIDHITPICRGGADTSRNVAAVHPSCNYRRPKDGSDIEKWTAFVEMKSKEKQSAATDHGGGRSG